MLTGLLERVSTGEAHVGIVGLGYVGLPLAVEFGKRFPTIGFDIKADRIAALKRGVDRTRETTAEQLAAASRLSLTSDVDELRACEVFIVTVPTPIDRAKQPDLQPLQSASRTVGRVLRPGAIVIYESTVYPGCTEEECVPILEKESGLALNRDFWCGYSPERINPGDRQHTVARIIKVTSGSTPAAAEVVDTLYRTVATAGTHRAPSIKVAEAAKVIENCQRDINIAFVNELAMIFHRMGIDTHDVLAAAGSKWNFLRFVPGLVGGHCIGVDPYYLTYKAQQVGHHPQIILAGRRTNDDMGRYVAGQVVKLLIRKGLPVKGARVLILGLTFKENVPDIRNSRVLDIVDELHEFGCTVDVMDPLADPAETRHEYHIEPFSRWEEVPTAEYDAVILAVAHDEFRNLDLRRFSKPDRVVYDLKNMLPRDQVDGRL